MTESIVKPEDSRLPLAPGDLMVRRCVRMVLERTWKLGHSHYIVAKEFGATPGSAYAAYLAALRYIRLSTDANATREQLLIRAREIVDQNEPDRLPALTLIAKMTGALEPPKSELRTHEERVAYLRECLREPDDELLEALHAERESVMAALSLETEGVAVQETEP